MVREDSEDQSRSTSHLSKNSTAYIDTLSCSAESVGLVADMQRKRRFQIGGQGMESVSSAADTCPYREDEIVSRLCDNCRNVGGRRIRS